MDFVIQQSEQICLLFEGAMGSIVTEKKEGKMLF